MLFSNEMVFHFNPDGRRASCDSNNNNCNKKNKGASNRLLSENNADVVSDHHNNNHRRRRGIAKNNNIVINTTTATKNLKFSEYNNAELKKKIKSAFISDYLLSIKEFCSNVNSDKKWISVKKSLKYASSSSSSLFFLGIFAIILLIFNHNVIVVNGNKMQTIQFGMCLFLFAGLKVSGIY